MLRSVIFVLSGGIDHRSKEKVDVMHFTVLALVDTHQSQEV